jgi:hypothetical protein
MVKQPSARRAVFSSPHNTDTERYPKPVTRAIRRLTQSGDGWHVRFWHKADITLVLNDVRFRG